MLVEEGYGKNADEQADRADRGNKEQWEAEKQRKK